MKYVGISLEGIADAMDDGVTKSDGTGLNYNSVAEAIWKSGYGGADGLNSRKLADLLWDEGASQAEIGQAMRYVGFNLETIADAMDDGVTKSDGTSLNYNSVATALWNNGHSINSRKLADLLWDEGASQEEIGQAMFHLDFGLTTIADAVKWGVSNSANNNNYLNYTSTATALWNSGHSIDTRKLADLLWDEGASQQEIGQAMFHLGFGLTTIADAVDDGVTLSDGMTLNYIDTALALWNSGHGINARKLADLLWDEGASQQKIGQAMFHLGFGLTTIAHAVKWGVSNLGNDNNYLNYTDTANALWNSGHKFDTRKLADLLWDEGASQQEIGQAMFHLGFGLTTIADAVDDGVTLGDGTTLNYIDTALALWNSGHKFDTRKLADLLWDEGASVSQIGSAIRYLGFDLRTIADALDDGVTKSDGTGLNYTSVAVGLWNSGHAISTEEVADLLWNSTDASQAEIAQALNYGIDRNLAEIASDMYYGVQEFNYYDVAYGLWNSGLAVNTRDIARELQDLGASAVDTAEVLHYELNASLEEIADALDEGATYGYLDIAYGLNHSGHNPSSGKLADLLRHEGAGYWATVDALQKVKGIDRWSAQGIVIGGIVEDYFDRSSKQISSISNRLESFYEDNKSTAGVLASPIIIGVEATKTIIKSIEEGNVEPIVDALKRIPVAGTAVGIIEGVINAVEGDEKEVLKSAIDSALAFYGGSNVITPKMVDFAVDVFWELKDNDYQGAISESLNNLGLEKTVSELFVSVAWAMEQGSWETAIDAALTKVGFENAQEFVDIAWDVIDNNYQGAISTVLELVGFDSLEIDRAKADAFIDVAVAVKDGDFNKVADRLIALAGDNAQQLSQSDWVKLLRDDNPADDRQALQLGLSELGFKNTTQWVDTIWAVKDGQYLDALSTLLSLGSFQDAQDWLEIIDNLKQEKYLDALSTAFDLAGFTDGQSLAEAAIAVRNGGLIDAFYESFDLIEGGSDLKNVFKALKENDLEDFVTSMVGALPILLKLVV